jgi:transposase
MKARFLELRYWIRQRLQKCRKEAEEEGAYRVARRIHAVLLNSGGHTSGDIATLLHSPRSKVSEWLQQYERHGYEALLEGHRTGRPCALGTEQKQELADIIESGPRAYGFLSGVWNALMIREVIQAEFAVEYDARHVRRILEELGFSVQRPKRVLAKADPAKQNRWRRYTYPNIKKKPVNKARESSSRMKPVSGRTPRSIGHGRDADISRKFR